MKKFNEIAGNIPFFDEVTGRLIKDIAPNELNGSFSTTLLTLDGVIEINALDDTKFDFPSGTGLIFKNSVPYYITWNAFTSQTTPFLASATNTFIAINENGALVLTQDLQDVTQMGDVIPIGFLEHLAGTVIERVGTEPQYNVNLGTQWQQFLETFGSFIVDGFSISVSLTNNLGLNVGAGTVFDNGLGFTQNIKAPNHFSQLAVNNVEIHYYHRDGIGGWNNTLSHVLSINPSLYDDGSGTLVAVPAGKFTIQRITYYPQFGYLDVYYDQKYYNTKEEAISGYFTDNIEENPYLSFNSNIAVLIVKSGTTDLNVLADAEIRPIKNNTIGGTSTGGGGGETNTASNVGTLGIGVFNQKVGVDLRFKNIAPNSNKVTITEDVNKNIKVDVDETNFSLTKSQVGLGNVPNVDATNPINISQSSDYRFVSDIEKTTWNNKEDSSNKSTSTSDSASTTKFPVWSAILSYFDVSRIKTILGITTLSGSNTGDETTLSIKTKRPLKTVNGGSLEGSGDLVVSGSVSGLNITNPYNTTLIQSASGTGGVANGTSYANGTNISISYPALPAGAVIVSTQVLISYTANNPSYLSELNVRMTPPNSAIQTDLAPSIANISGSLSDIILANFTTENPVGNWLFEFKDTFDDTGVDVNISDITINTTYTLNTNLYDFDGVIQAKKFIGDGSQLTNLPQGVQLVKAYLTQTQAITVTTPNTLTNHVFIIPPTKTLSLQGTLVFTSAATNTGAYYGILVNQPVGANGNAIGSFSAEVGVSSSVAASGLRDGDAINVAGGGSLESGVLGTASTAGNNSGNMILNVINTSTNVSTVVELRFRSETNGTAVTAQIGTMATGLIG